ncbi:MULTISPECIES: hypothetical protein [unclassified Streptomyces]|uniref:hypothetical protein n=1 Tax=unclassified Streptomyces TaxID=2593676 RepID=UPI002254D516|nr:hypothetical protein [Streptomyces sp. NBC_00047]MCX5606707.1 hypothetical protein [Streptomyces sp. NBC_00047]
MADHDVSREAGVSQWSSGLDHVGQRADLRTLAKSRLRRRLVLLASGEVHGVEDSVRLILGLQC